MKVNIGSNIELQLTTALISYFYNVVCMLQYCLGGQRTVGLVMVRIYLVALCMASAR